jgi:hypothetical protein
METTTEARVFYVRWERYMGGPTGTVGPFDTEAEAEAEAHAIRECDDDARVVTNRDEPFNTPYLPTDEEQRANSIRRHSYHVHSHTFMTAEEREYYFPF